MTRSHFSPSTPFLRLVCLIICASLIAPFFAFIPEAGLLVARASTSTETINGNTPRKVEQTDQKVRWRDGELLVRFRPNVAALDIDALLQANRAERAGRLRGQSGIERLRLTAGSDPTAVAATLQSSQLVDLAEPNYLIMADQVSPDDPRFSEQWALRNTGNAGTDINAGQAWESTTGSKRTVIAVIDSGIDFTHPDLSNNQWGNSLELANDLDDDRNGFINDFHGWDFVANTKEIKDEQGHGTAVAGIIAAQGNNATGITGVMWSAGLMSVRVLDKTGTGDIASAVEAIDYAVTNGAQVINCSWGTDDASIALLEAINQASRRGVIVVTSAGNDSRDIEKTPRYPASYDLNNLMTVASTDNADLPATWSNWGATHVTINAPGKDILTTKMGGDYQMVSGSSASAPLVIGVAGLIKTLRPWLNADLTREIIIRGARKVSSLTGKVASGGVVNATGAVEALNTLSPAAGRENGNGNDGINGGEHGNNGNGRSHRGDTRPGRGNGNGPGTEPSVTPLPVTPGAPGAGLPNLDDLRRKQPTVPKAPDPIPSTRCSHLDPQCDKPKGKDKAALESSNELLAWDSGSSLLISWLNPIRGALSDSPFSLYGGANKKMGL
jgi:subtilisin family serine protease